MVDRPPLQVILQVQVLELSCGRDRSRWWKGQSFRGPAFGFHVCEKTRLLSLLAAAHLQDLQEGFAASASDEEALA